MCCNYLYQCRILPYIEPGNRCDGSNIHRLQEVRYVVYNVLNFCNFRGGDKGTKVDKNLTTNVLIIIYYLFFFYPERSCTFSCVFWFGGQIKATHKRTYPPSFSRKVWHIWDKIYTLFSHSILFSLRRPHFFHRTFFLFLCLVSYKLTRL